MMVDHPELDRAALLAEAVIAVETFYERLVTGPRECSDRWDASSSSHSSQTRRRKHPT